MVVTATNLRGHQRDEGQKPATRKQTRRRVRFLAVVDDTECTNRVIGYLIAACDPRVTEVLVLNVQEKRDDGRLRGYQSFMRDKIDARLIEEFGTPIVTSACRSLEKAELKAVPAVAVGEPVATILCRAAEERCDVVVIGTDSHAGGIRKVLEAFGLSFIFSRAARVSAQAPVTVAVVK